jgi:hypothetical protein
MKNSLYLFFLSFLVVFPLNLRAEQIRAGVLITDTTPTPVVPPTVDQGSVVTGISAVSLGGFNVSSPQVFPSSKGVTMTFASSKATKYSVYLGTTEALDMGLVGTSDWSMEHEVKISDLVPNTKYFFKITLTDSSGNTRNLDLQSFMTLPAPSEPIQFISLEGLVVVPNPNYINISWPPLTGDNYKIRIIRSYKFYPRDQFDGVPVYEGTGSSFKDEYNLVSGQEYFYTVFICDSVNKCSPGQSFKAATALKTDTLSLKEKEFNITRDVDLRVFDLKVYSDNKEVPAFKNNFYLKGHLPIQISFKSSHPSNEVKMTAAFISSDTMLEQLYPAQYNEEREFFETGKLYLREGGSYVVSVGIYDYKNNLFITPQFILNMSAEAISEKPRECDGGWIYSLLCHFVSIAKTVISRALSVIRTIWDFIYNYLNFL